jgi:hypothetical protein
VLLGGLDALKNKDQKIAAGQPTSILQIPANPCGSGLAREGGLPIDKFAPAESESQINAQIKRSQPAAAPTSIMAAGTQDQSVSQW